MVNSTWQPHALNVTVETVGAAPPKWTECKLHARQVLVTVAVTAMNRASHSALLVMLLNVVVDDGKGYTCTASEYKGTASDINKTAAGCLAAAEQMSSKGVNYATYPGNGGCFVCSVPDAASKLTPKKGQVTFVGTNIVRPISVSAQQSSDGATVVVRLVNNAAMPAKVDLVLDSTNDANYDAAHAIQLQSDDPNDANPSWDVDKISPKQVQVSVSGGKAAMTLPPYSYTVVVATE